MDWNIIIIGTVLINISSALIIVFKDFSELKYTPLLAFSAIAMEEAVLMLAITKQSCGLESLQSCLSSKQIVFISDRIKNSLSRESRSVLVSQNEQSRDSNWIGFD